MKWMRGYGTKLVWNLARWCVVEERQGAENKNSSPGRSDIAKGFDALLTARVLQHAQLQQKHTKTPHFPNEDAV